jgi:glycosyltransferase involved in cell wall biosynthesis
MKDSCHNIVCISTIDWDFIWQGHQEIMSTFARDGHRVLFIENTGVRRPTLKDLPRLRKRFANWRNGTRGIRQVMDNLYVYSPLVLPFPYSRVARMINRLIMIMTLRSWARTMHFESPIIWTWLPTALALDLIKALHGKLTIYYCFDNFEAMSKGMHKIRRTEQRLLRKADLVFATARNLFEYCAQFTPNVHLFPSGFSKRIFARDSFRLPDDVARLPRPIVGYVGGVHKVVDLDLIKQVASSQPHVSFVFVGPLQTDVSQLAGCPNVHFLGQKDHTLLPDYIYHFDVCVIPYVLNEYTRNVYPTKLNEYLILGKPVIATRIPELEYFSELNPGVVALASDPHDFVRHIPEAMREDSDAVRARRKEVAERNSWEQKIAAMTALIDAKLEEKKKLRDLSWRENLVAVYNVSKRRVLATLATATVPCADLVAWIAAEACGSSSEG